MLLSLSIKKHKCNACTCRLFVDLLTFFQKEGKNKINPLMPSVIFYLTLEIIISYIGDAWLVFKITMFCGNF